MHAPSPAPPRQHYAEPPRPTRFRRFLRWCKPPRRLRLTREGRFFVLTTFGLGAAAINTGNNLLYLLFGLFCSLIITSGVLSELSLRDLRIVRRLPRRSQVGRPHIVEIEVFNEKKRIPSYAIEVEDLRAGQPADKRCFFLKVSPLSTQVAAYRRTPARRGLDQHTGFRVATRFPFGFFEKSRDLESASTLLIYPAIDRIRLPADPPGPALASFGTPARGHGDEILALRPMRDGDDPRDIYWRRSTRPDHMVLRERAAETRRDVTLVLDTTFTDIEPHPTFLELLEHRIREVASLTVAHLRQGHSVTLRTTAGDQVQATPATGADPPLTFLALLQATGAKANPPLIARMMPEQTPPHSTRPAIGTGVNDTLEGEA